MEVVSKGFLIVSAAQTDTVDDPALATATVRWTTVLELQFFASYTSKTYELFLVSTYRIASLAMLTYVLA